MRNDLLGYNYPPSTLGYVPRVIPDIAPFDEMFAGDNRQAYYECGASALNCMLAAVQLAGVPRPSRILDFGCGAGRVTRWVRAAFLEADVHGCEISRLDTCLDFVRKTFGVQTWNSDTQIDALKAPTTYDLIWVGSVFTHLSAVDSESLFQKLTGWLNPNGLLVFTVHGRRAILYDAQNPNTYGLEPGQRALALKGYRSRGFGYSDYTWSAENGGGYGISFSTSEWWVSFIEQQPRMRLVTLSEAAWDKHQDVVAVLNGPDGYLAGHQPRRRLLGFA